MPLICSRTWAVLLTGFFSTGCTAMAVAAAVGFFSSSGRFSVTRRPFATDQPVSGILLDPVLEHLFSFVALAATLAGFDVLLGFPMGNEARFLGGFFHFLADFLFDFVGLFFFLLFFEVFVVPEVGLVKDALGCVARVEDDFVNPRFEVGLTQVGAGSLQRIKKEAGGFVLDLPGEEQAHDLHEGHLDGVGVFEHRQEDGGRAATASIDVQTDALFLKPAFFSRFSLHLISGLRLNCKFPLMR
jgi:hypothetical protein